MSETPESIGLRHGIRVPPGYTVVGGAIVRVDDPTPTTNPQDQDYWPQDSLHDAARQVVGGMKGLVPNARRTLREVAERADAPPVGRAASDAAIGRALRIGL